MIRRWLALTYYLYALRLAALSHFYFNPLYLKNKKIKVQAAIGLNLRFSEPMCVPAALLLNTPKAACTRHIRLLRG